MRILQTPAALLIYLAALLLTLLGIFLKNKAFLSYIGGICQASFVIAAWFLGVPISEILVLTLVLLVAIEIGSRKGDSV